MAIVALFSPTTVRRRPDTCTNCLRCSHVCPSHLPVHKQLKVISPACSGCMDCINACPSAGTLAMRTPGMGVSGWNTKRIALAVGLAFAVMVVAAKISGHWQSGIGDVEFRMLLRMIDDPMMTHPTFYPAASIESSSACDFMGRRWALLNPVWDGTDKPAATILFK